ncbi:Alpha/Beta hydrolase protein [Syncephalis fuscata]|nr:Alpha/Beta hydrolase protein [Syncephalis fuscata]
MSVLFSFLLLQSPRLLYTPATVLRTAHVTAVIPTCQPRFYASLASVRRFPTPLSATMSTAPAVDASALVEDVHKQQTQDTVKCRSYLGLDRLSYWFRPTSEEESRQAEARLLLRTPGFVAADDTSNATVATDSPPAAHIRWVDIGKGQYINTLTLEPPNKTEAGATTEDTKVLVLAHGFGAGLAYFYRNFSGLIRPGWRVYAIDWLGMGRSARVEFPSHAGKKSKEEYTDMAEEFFIDSLERWRKTQGIEKMTLAGHSMGGYMSTVYSLRYPERVERLVLISPVGIPEQPSETEQAGAAAEATAGMANEVSKTVDLVDDDTANSTNQLDDLPPPKHEFQGRHPNGPPRKIPGWVSTMWDRNFTPQWFVRAMGPFGPRLVSTYVQNRMAHLSEEDRADLQAYTYHISSAPGSGEYSLAAVLAPGAHARRPLKDRLPNICMPTTFIYGDKDWMDYRHAVRAQPHMKVETEVVRIPNGGHHMYMENPEVFAETMQTEMEKAELGTK